MAEGLPGALPVPAGHAAQTDAESAPSAVEYESAAHGVHASAASRSEKEPAGQREQPVGGPLAFVEKLPAAQGRQSVAPCAAE